MLQMFVVLRYFGTCSLKQVCRFADIFFFVQNIMCSSVSLCVVFVFCIIVVLKFESSLQPDVMCFFFLFSLSQRPEWWIVLLAGPPTSEDVTLLARSPLVHLLCLAGFWWFHIPDEIHCAPGDLFRASINA